MIYPTVQTTIFRHAEKNKKKEIVTDSFSLGKAMRTAGGNEKSDIPPSGKDRVARQGIAAMIH